MPTLTLPLRPLTTDVEIHAVLGFRDSGLIDWGFTEEDLPVPGPRVYGPRRDQVVRRAA